MEIGLGMVTGLYRSAKKLFGDLINQMVMEVVVNTLGVLRNWMMTIAQEKELIYVKYLGHVRRPQLNWYHRFRAWRTRT